MIVLAATYLGFMTKVKLADNIVATTYIGTIAFLRAIGGIFFWFGDTVPILGNYLGGACLLPLIGTSFLNFMGWFPKELVAGTRVLMRRRFQDAYSYAVSRLNSRNGQENYPDATARYIPTLIGSQAFAIGFAMLGRFVTGYGVSEALFDITAPCTSGGSVGSITTLPKLYSDISGVEMMPQAGKYLSYASIANVLAVVLAAFFGALTKLILGLNGDGQFYAGEFKKTLKQRNAK